MVGQTPTHLPVRPNDNNDKEIRGKAGENFHARSNAKETCNGKRNKGVDPHARIVTVDATTRTLNSDVRAR